MGGRQEGMPALAVNGGPIKLPGATAAQQHHHPQQADATAANTAAAAAARPPSSPTPGPSSLDLGSTSNARSVAFKNNVVVVGGGSGGGAGSGGAGAGSSPSSSSARSSQMHKCRSLPRLSSSAQSSPMTAVPLAFPRIHVASAMLSSSDLMLDTDQLSMAGNVGLLRSMSARTVDSLVHMDRSLASSNSGSRFLSPSGDVTTDNLAARSTSCPSMAYPMLTCRSGSHFQLRPSGEERDVNLDGEEITDLPIEPTQNFPDLIPELQEDYTPDSHNGNLPLYSDICDDQGGTTTPSRAAGEAPDQRHNNNDKKAPAQSGAGSGEGKDTKQRSDGNYNVSAREKCIRWLKSLSIDKS